MEEGPGVSEILPAEALSELRETARPYAVADAARALADAVVALSEDGDPEAAVKAARVAKRAAPRAASVREALGIALYQVGTSAAPAPSWPPPSASRAGRPSARSMSASAYGDLGQPASGVALIRRHARWPTELADHHLRLAYAEGALAEQAGDLPRARAAFTRVVQADPDFHDAADRLDRLTPS